ncbi:hypothetical protein EIN_482480 [Entamoeba invadens IP1]|uniref:Transmembrane protein n=1 Tax=Entamoeba invadens IP1 TaxID=370355 RepID=A0A0A1UAI3_ENTIV|nr:hypothetical protein EIN_482480 [Entamoeba invadens IP1]ELP90194.1 hypothetical protein EIN_482480 [Entamoeba invadens IP1]|eukprot:XP_004256965.1 hypothetical protein EIN_482480 [Entamoeba invadens IP1]
MTYQQQPQYAQYIQPIIQTPPQYQQAPVQPIQLIPQSEIIVPSYQSEQKVNVTNQNDSMMSAILFGFGFLLCCLWLVDYCKYRNSKDVQARSIALVSFVFFIISTVFTIFVVGYLISCVIELAVIVNNRE